MGTRDKKYITDVDDCMELNLRLAYMIDDFAELVYQHEVVTRQAAQMKMMNNPGQGR